jgi:hypothetical protein
MKVVCHTEPRGMNGLEGFNRGDLYPARGAKIGNKEKLIVYTSNEVIRDRYIVSKTMFNRFFAIA